MTGARGVGITTGVPFSSNTPGDGIGAITFASPVGTVLRSAVVYRWGKLASTSNHMTFTMHSGLPNDHYHAPTASGCVWASSCVGLGDALDVWSAANRVPFPTPVQGGFSLSLGCDIPDATYTCVGNDQSVVRLFGAKLTMADDTNPQVSGQPSGSLVGPGVVRGTGDVTVNATDSGSGVYRVKLVVDDVVRLTRVVDANGGRCADVNPHNVDEYEFADPAPCKTSAGGTYRFDTTALPEGDHTLQVLLEDAAGNSATWRTAR